MHKVVKTCKIPTFGDGLLYILVEVVLQFCSGTAVFVRHVFDDPAFLKQGDTGRDVNSVLQVMTGNEYRSLSLAIVCRELMLQDVLRLRVEKVEGLIENHQLRTIEEG